MKNLSIFFIYLYQTLILKFYAATRNNKYRKDII